MATIGANAFGSVMLAEHSTTIGSEQELRGCAFTKLVIKDGTTPLSIGPEAFIACTKLSGSTIDLPKRVSKLSGGAFYFIQDATFYVRNPNIVLEGGDISEHGFLDNKDDVWPFLLQVTTPEEDPDYFEPFNVYEGWQADPGFVENDQDESPWQMEAYEEWAGQFADPWASEFGYWSWNLPKNNGSVVYYPDTLTRSSSPTLVGFLNATANSGISATAMQQEGWKYPSFEPFDANGDGKATQPIDVRTSLANATIDPIPDQRYTGHRVRPVPVVKMGSTTLKLGTDFDVYEYYCNVDINDKTSNHDLYKPSLTIVGRGKYIGSRYAEFNIVEATGTDISSAKVTLATTSYTYDGKEKKPSVKSVVLGSKTLKSGTDYTVSYANNINVGTATVTVTGKGSYWGSASATFTIKKAAQAITVGDTDVTIGGTAQLRATASGGGKLSYSSSNTAIAKVSSTGEVTGVKAGNVTITVKAAATANYNAASRTITVNVVKWKRLWGAGSLDTAAAIVDEGWADGAGGTVVVARNDDFKDALAGAGLAGLTGGPIVLTSRDALAQQARDELVRLKPKRVYVAGGEGAVRPAVVTAIEKATGLTVQKDNSSAKTGIIRLWGSGSPQTSAALATAGRGSWGDTAIIATNGSFKDALSAAPISYAKHWPILLASGGQELAPEVISALKSLGIKRAFIMGGTGAVKPKVEDQLKGAGITMAGRKAGYWGWETSREIANWGLSLGLTADGMGYATSQRFPDALAGAALLGRNGSVLLLADQATQGNLQFARDHAPEITHGYVFGGEGAFSKACYDQLPK